jgi:sugar O-acyltransferase (sialic acid O-acetyltransferase NeuD family)
MSLPVVLLGGGGHASVLASALRQSGRTIAGCIAPVPPLRLSGVRHLGSDAVLEAMSPRDVELAVAVGSIAASKLRKMLYDNGTRLGFRFAEIIHPSAIVDRTAKLGYAAQIMAGAIVQAGAEIGQNVIVNSGAIIEHGCRIGDHVHVASGAVTGGEVTVGTCSHVGAGAVVLQGCIIGEFATIGASACVTRDVVGGLTVIGIPAREHRGRSGAS